MSSSSGSSQSGSTSTTASIEKQIRDIQQEIQETNQSQLDAKTKASKPVELEKELQLLEMQLVQKQSQQSQAQQTPAAQTPSSPSTASPNALNLLA